jgi:hypothetical protein
MRLRARSSIPPALAALLSWLAGCGSGLPPTYPVSGKVRFADGAPVTWGSVEFYSPATKLAARGTIQPDGTFQLSTFGDRDGAVAGKHQVTIVQTATIDRPIAHHHPQSAGVHPRYASPVTSKLERTVVASGDNQLVIRVERAAK